MIRRGIISICRVLGARANFNFVWVLSWCLLLSSGSFIFEHSWPTVATTFLTNVGVVKIVAFIYIYILVLQPPICKRLATLYLFFPLVSRFFHLKLLSCSLRLNTGLVVWRLFWREVMPLSGQKGFKQWPGAGRYISVHVFLFFFLSWPPTCLFSIHWPPSPSGKIAKKGLLCICYAMFFMSDVQPGCRVLSPRTMRSCEQLWSYLTMRVPLHFFFLKKNGTRYALNVVHFSGLRMRCVVCG